MDKNKPKLFSMVKCRAYLKRVKDSVHIIIYNPDGSFCHDKIIRDHDATAKAYKRNDAGTDEIEIADLSDFCGGCVEKVYRERVEEEFVGCVVGYTRVDVKGLIGTDWCDDPYVHYYGFCFKEVTERPHVAVVYFKNNCKRYVLLDDIESIDKQEDT